MLASVSTGTQVLNSTQMQAHGSLAKQFACEDNDDMAAALKFLAHKRIGAWW